MQQVSAKSKKQLADHHVVCWMGAGCGLNTIKNSMLNLTPTDAAEICML